jgi:hypothetical protein
MQWRNGGLSKETKALLCNWEVDCRFLNDPHAIALLVFIPLPMIFHI